jgi:hypothetical protein
MDTATFVNDIGGVQCKRKRLEPQIGRLRDWLKMTHTLSIMGHILFPMMANFQTFVLIVTTKKNANTNIEAIVSRIVSNAQK